MCIAGVALGAYVGIWLCFIGGIMDVITEVRAPEMDGMNIAIGIAKVVFAQAIGGVSAVWLLIPGAALVQER